MVEQVSRSTRKPNTRKTTPGTKRKLAAAIENTANSEITEEKKAALLGIPKEFEELEISLINKKSGTQPRGYVDNETIEAYADSMVDQYDQFPPVTVFYDGTNHYLADGFHRVAAAELNNRKTIKSDIRSGTLEEAQWFSYSANSLHGLRRTNKDKERAVKSALKHPNAAKMTNSSLGKYLGVSENTIKKYRDLLGVEKTETRTVERRGQDGKIQQFEQAVSSEKRSKATQRKEKKDAQTTNKYEFWEQNGEWEILIPNDRLSSKILVKYSIEEAPKRYKFEFEDKNKALLPDGQCSLFIKEDQEKEAATPFLFAQGQIKEWVDQEENRKKRFFEVKDAGFASGVRVRHAKYGEGVVEQINQLGLINVRYENNLTTTSQASDLTIIPIRKFTVGDIVRVTSNGGWPNNQIVKIKKEMGNSYLVKEWKERLNAKGEDKSQTTIVEWWKLEISTPSVEMKSEEESSNLPIVVESEEPDPDDYYQQALDCLPELTDQELIKLKFYLDREMKMRGLEENDDIQKFQSALVKYAASLGKSSPEAWASTVANNHKKGQHSPLWDDFIKGLPLGSGSQIKRDWEIEAGVPYPAFKEERIQYWVAKGEPIESATVKAGTELRSPELAKDLWEGFLRKSNRIADDALKAKSLGATPYLPPAFTQGETITKESVIAKLEAIAEQHSLPESKPETQPEQSEIKSDEPAAKPTIEEIQKYLDFPGSKGIAMIRIRENPQWGYEILDGKVIETSDINFINLAKAQIPELIAVVKETEPWASQPHYIALSREGGKYRTFGCYEGIYTKKNLLSQSEIDSYYSEAWTNPEIIFGSLKEEVTAHG